MKWTEETIKITIKRIDNGYVTTISNEHGYLIASWYDVHKKDALKKIGDQLGIILPSQKEDDPHPYTKGLDNRVLTEKEEEGLNEEMNEIRDKHLEKMEENNDKKETSTRNNSTNKD